MAFCISIIPQYPDQTQEYNYADTAGILLPSWAFQENKDLSDA